MSKCLIYRLIILWTDHSCYVQFKTVQAFGTTLEVIFYRVQA